MNHDFRCDFARQFLYFLLTLDDLVIHNDVFVFI